MSGAADSAEVLRITRGTPQPEELAALLLALRVLSAAGRHDGPGSQEAPATVPGWAARCTTLRRQPWSDHQQLWPPAAWDGSRDSVRRATVR